MGYKLNKIAKGGLAIGIAAIIALSASGCTNKYSSYTGNPSTSVSQTYQNDYIDVITSNEFRVYDEDLNTTNIKLNNIGYMDIINALDGSDYTFEYAQYYGLDEALGMYNSTTVNKKTTSSLLDANGNLDPQKLAQQILANNKAYMAQGKDAINSFYTDISSTDLNMICNIIAEVTNKEYNGVQKEKVANTLMQMTMFQRTGSASNAYVTNNLTFVYNPTMSNLYASKQEIEGTSTGKEDTVKQVITHEVMHLLQYASNDTNEKNGLESGICRMYNLPNQDKKIPVDSLWNSWLLEAAAELGMAEYLNIEPGTYAKKISYARSYNLSRFNDLDLANHSIEDVVFNHTLEEAYKELGLNSEEEKREFLNFLYSVEITQSDPEDFWENYTTISGITPTEDEKLGIRMDIRTDAVKFLSRNFYENLADAIYTGSITDLDTVFYLVRNWELDVYGHLEYTKTSSLEHAKDFVLWQNDIQNSLFSAIANSNNTTLEDITSQYAEYNLQASVDNQIYNNCQLSNFNEYTASYITDAKDSYSTSRFSRNSLVADYITSSTKTSENDISYGK